MHVHRNPLPQLVPQRFWKIAQRVSTLLYPTAQPVDVLGSKVIEDPIDLTAAKKLKLAPVKPGEHFGPAGGGWHQRWFKLSIPAPRKDERGRRFLRWRCQGETTVYLDGEPWAGLDVGHPTCPLPDHAATLWLDCSTWVTGIWVRGSEPVGPYGLRFDGAEVVVRDETAWQLHHDLDALRQLLDLMLADEDLKLPAGNGFAAPLDDVAPLLRRLVTGLDELCDAWVDGGMAAMAKASAALIKAMPAEWWQPTAALAGHAHIDLVWLWPEMAADRKAVHSFASMIRLLDQYPEMRFVQSMPSLYRAIERLSPPLMKQIKRKIADGQWEVMGGFEVEPDVNLPAGEALARSLVYGNRKIAELMGKPSRVCWIPDVFGYSNCLPQVLRLGGVDRFYTTKMSWSCITRFPYNSFVWQGSDGSEVVSHLSTIGYNGEANLPDNRSALRHHRQADIHPEMLIGTGYGDGGGGVNETVVERARRFSNLAGSPRNTWSTADAFFRRLEKVRDKLPIYRGELYLEYHRGVQTSQAEFKRLYRACETALQAHEALRVAQGGQPLGEDAWLRVCFGQFHDALPGSSIAIVYEQLEAEYRQIVQREQDAAEKELRGGKRGGGAVAFNPLPVPRTVVIDAPGSKEHKPVRVALPALGTARLKDAAAEVEPVKASPKLLDNGRVRAAFDNGGRLTALRIDGEDLLLEAPARFMLHHDQPHMYDAWDIDHYTIAAGAPAFEKMKLAVVEDAGVRATLEGKAKLGDGSAMTVRYLLDAGSLHLRVECEVDWQERDRLLRFAVPTGYRGEHAVFGCPFGSIKRPQRLGTPSDEAMWEVPASRWAAALDDTGRGLALLTEAKFGFSCKDGLLGLSLLKSPRHPDPEADRGTHTIRFALGAFVAHTDEQSMSTAIAADALFAPVVTAAAGEDLAAPFELRELGTLCPSWVTPSETGTGFVLRAHETAGAPGSFVLKLNRKARGVTLVDFNEKKLADLPAPEKIDSNSYRVSFKPYQVLTVLVR